MNAKRIHPFPDFHESLPRREWTDHLWEIITDYPIISLIYVIVMGSVISGMIYMMVVTCKDMCRAEEKKKK